MKAIRLILVSYLFALLLGTPSAHSQSYLDEETLDDLAPGMELIIINNVRYLVPRGTKIREIAGVITFEGPGEYTARRLTEFDAVIRENDKEIKRLRRELRRIERDSSLTIR